MGSRIGRSSVRAAILNSRGNLTNVADALNCSRQTVYNYIEKYPDLKELLEQQRDTLVDLAENKLAKLIEEGVLGAVLFTLETMGKKRGWTKRLELTADDGDDLAFKIYGIPDMPLSADNKPSNKPL